MVDYKMPIDYVSLIVAITSFLLSALSHIRYSKCSNCMEVQMEHEKTPLVKDKK